MNFYDIAIRRPVFTAMLMIALVVFGILGYQTLPINLLPSLDIPIVTGDHLAPGCVARGHGVRCHRCHRVGGQHHRGHQAAHLVLGPGRLVGDGHLHPGARHRHRRPGCARQGLRRHRRSCPSTPNRPSSRSSTPTRNPCCGWRSPGSTPANSRTTPTRWSNPGCSRSLESATSSSPVSASP